MSKLSSKVTVLAVLLALASTLASYEDSDFESMAVDRFLTQFDKKKPSKEPQTSAKSEKPKNSKKGKNESKDSSNAPENEEEDSESSNDKQESANNKQESANDKTEPVSDMLEQPKDFQLERIKNLEHKCNPELMRLFGLNVKDNIKPMNQTFETRQFCKWNTFTCCSEDNFKDFQKFFHLGLKKFYQEMYMTEQLLLIFNGKQEIISYEKLKKKKSCHIYLNDVVDSKGNKYYKNSDSKDGLNSFFQDAVREAEIFKGYLVRTDVRNFFYGIRNLYAGLICAICSSIDNQFFILREGMSTVIINHMTIDKIVELLDFEVRLAKFLHYYVRPFANVVRCANEQLDKVEFSIESTPIEQVEALERIVYYCTTDSHHYQHYCKKLLKINLYGRKGLFNSPNIVKQSLKVLFLQFYQLEIEEFYREYFKATFQLDEEVYTNFFDKHNSQRKKYNFTTPRIEIDDEGLDLVENDISPIFYEFQRGPGKWAGRVASMVLWALAFVSI